MGCATTKGTGQPDTGRVDANPVARKLLNEDMLAINDPNAPYPWIIPEPDTPPKRGGIFRDSWVFDIGSLDPTTSSSVTSTAVPSAVAEHVLDYVDGARENPFKQDLKPGLATSWEITPDGLTLTFRITNKAKWHNKPPVNARPFTAEDVRYVYERDRSTGVSRGYFENVASITAVDPTTLQMKFKAPQPDFLIFTAARESVIYAREQVDNGDLAKAVDVIGTGPFIITSLRKSDHVSYARNPDYWKPGLPYLDGAETRMMPDQAARLAALRAGQFEIASSIFNNKRDADALRKSNPEFNIVWNVVVVGAPLLGTINYDNAHWKDERVRQAMTLGVDRERQIKVMFDGYGFPNLRELPWPSIFDKPPTTPAELGPYLRYDPAEARKLLLAAGQENMKVDWYVQSTTADSVVGFAVDNFKAIGVTVVPRIEQYVTVQQAFQQRRFPDTTNGSVNQQTTDSFYKDSLKTNGSVNLSGLSDPQIDQWADQESVEINPQKRREILRKIWDYMAVKAYKPMAGAGGGAPAAAWANYVRNYWGGNAINTFTFSTEPVRHLGTAWIDRDNPSGRV